MKCCVSSRIMLVPILLVCVDLCVHGRSAVRMFARIRCDFCLSQVIKLVCLCLVNIRARRRCTGSVMTTDHPKSSPTSKHVCLYPTETSTSMSTVLLGNRSLEILSIAAVPCVQIRFLSVSTQGICNTTGIPQEQTEIETEIP